MSFGRVRSQDRPEVVPAHGEEAGVELPVGRESRAGAVAAEGLRDRGDDAEFARAVEVAVPLGHLSAVRGSERLERELRSDRGHDLGSGHDILCPPAIRGPDVHELDEANDVPGPAKPSCDVEDRALVLAPLDDDVHLHGQPCGRGRVDTRENPGHGKVDVVHRPEHLVVEGVEAHGDAREPCLRERGRLALEERGVGRERDVKAIVDPDEPLDQPLEIAPQERLATGDPKLVDAQLDERPGHSLDLLEGQKLAPRQEPVLAAEDLLRHAVDAAEVAAVGDGDPQIANRPAERVRRGHRDAA